MLGVSLCPLPVAKLDGLFWGAGEVGAGVPGGSMVLSGAASSFALAAKGGGDSDFSSTGVRLDALDTTTG